MSANPDSTYRPVGDPTKDLKQWPNGSVPEARLEALQKVRDLLKAQDYHRENYICFALDTVRVVHPHLYRACEDLKRFVRIEIEGYSSLQCFITAEMFGFDTRWSDFPEPYKNDYYHNRGVMQLARAAWIDKLIENESAPA